MNSSEIEKKYRTYIKSAQGAMAIALVLTLVYIVRAAISGNLDFWFCTYVVEFLIKSAGFFAPYEVSLSQPIAVTLIVLFIAVLAVAVVLSQKNGKWLYACLVLYGIDTVFLLWGDFSNHFAVFAQDQWIDIIVHAFIILFTVVGIVGCKGLTKMDLSVVESKETAKE
ncbi:MAG: hypothetical protein NC122_02560 [Faecalibacterium sp.]|nr:hypothetical protein [Ruminococcus sp.]MCM1391975.1 hypothetical protein [Ruminococcus sp.]MCM1485066.1 hypothetical protein [Faecalibacterium sp.]